MQTIHYVAQRQIGFTEKPFVLNENDWVGHTAALVVVSGNYLTTKRNLNCSHQHQWAKSNNGISQWYSTKPADNFGLNK